MMVWLLVLVPLAGAAAVALLPRSATALAMGALACTAALGVTAAATEAASSLPWGPGLELTVAATGFVRAMVVLVPVIAFPIVLYAAATETLGHTRLIALLTAFVGAMELLVLSGDFLTLLIGWELVGALSWVLIAHEWREAANVRKASHAFITTRAGDLGLYVAAGLAFASTGSFGFTGLAEVSPSQLQFITGAILVAAGVKSAQVPSSPWLFSAMAGPTPVSALLHSSTMVAAGTFLLIRLAHYLDAVTWFAPTVIAVGLASALAGGVVAAVHRHPKRLFAASTTAQYGLMFVAIGTGSLVAAAAQLVAHAAFKSLLFLSAGVAIQAADSDDLYNMRLGRRLPVIAGFAAIGALALAALPPLGGAWSKEQIAAGAFESSPFLGAAVLGAALLSAFYALRFWLLAFGPGRPEPSWTTPNGVQISVGFLGSVSLGLGVLWVPAVNQAAAGLVPGEVRPTRALELALGLASLAAAAGMVVVLQRRARLARDHLGASAADVATGWFGIESVSRRVVVDPVLAISRVLASFDDHVVDAGIRASARIASGFSRLLRRRSELSIDAIVNGIGAGMLLMAMRSRAADDDGIDRAAEGVARGLGRAGEQLRRLQTGLSHHYYVIVAIGLVVIVAGLAMGTS